MLGKIALISSPFPLNCFQPLSVSLKHERKYDIEMRVDEWTSGREEREEHEVRKVQECARKIPGARKVEKEQNKAWSLVYFLVKVVHVMIQALRSAYITVDLSSLFLGLFNLNSPILLSTR